MDKITKSDIEKAQGTAGFLIPLEILPENVGLKRPGGFAALNLLGTVREIDGQRYLEVERWKML